MSPSPQDILSPVLLGVSAFTAFMPEMRKVRATHPVETDGVISKDMRTGEYAAAFVAVLAGALIAVWTHEYYPLFIAGITVLAMVYLYETVYRLEP